VTIDERIDRLEFLNAAYIEQRRKDWEEYLVRERDLRSHIEAIWRRQERRDEELDKRWRETQDMFRETKDIMRETSRQSEERVENLVIAIGKFIEKVTRNS
jgi:uncharacterized protein YlxW (UPF0749 family)